MWLVFKRWSHKSFQEFANCKLRWHPSSSETKWKQKKLSRPKEMGIGTIGEEWKGELWDSSSRIPGVRYGCSCRTTHYVEEQWDPEKTSHSPLKITGQQLSPSITTEKYTVVPCQRCVNHYRRLTSHHVSFFTFVGRRPYVFKPFSVVILPYFVCLFSEKRGIENRFLQITSKSLKNLFSPKCSDRVL